MSDAILITSAAGGIGRPLVGRLSGAGEHVRAFVKNQEQADVVRAAGAIEVVVGDLRDADDLRRALTGVGRAYHAAPTQVIDEQPILDTFLEAGADGTLSHLVFHSVVHPDLSVLPHHHQKAIAEQRLRESGLPLTVLRPSHYMQNYLELWDFMRVGSMPYPVDPSIPMGVVDVEDVADAAAAVLTAPDAHLGRTYDLSTQELTRHEMAALWSDVLGHPITAVRVPPTSIRNPLQAVGVLPRLLAALPAPRVRALPRLLGAIAGARDVRGMRHWQPDAIETYAIMMEHYDTHGLPVGEIDHLPALLGRHPTSYREFARREATRRAAH